MFIHNRRISGSYIVRIWLLPHQTAPEIPQRVACRKVKPSLMSQSNGHGRWCRCADRAP